MSTTVTARPKRDIDVGTFADITPATVTAIEWTATGELAVTFDATLTPAVIEAVRIRMVTRNANDELLYTQAIQAMDTNRSFIALASPTQAQAVAQVKALSRQNIVIIRQVLGLLDSTT